ncbi:hypothetical protein F4561_001494 [Lipingzhangella halophila]|uniref:Uncharacterized protein n=1 Tax=Lipingzhangella halophila TaxID=1783352 RepID=A0A7W7W2E3_9ACTN|nr:hypothetical protein [Lipingzhangella halophila]MBB4930674.1 hypothetical protein [Lipingzhangella halophila]
MGSDDHFDRYFVFGIPEDDLSERAFNSALEQLGAGQVGGELEAFVARIRQDTQRMARRVHHRRDQGGRLPSRELLQVLADNFGQLESDSEMGGLLTPERSAEVVAGDLLADVQVPEVADVLERMASTPDGARLACAAFHHLNKEADTVEPAASTGKYRDAERRLGHRIRGHLAPAGSRPAADLSPEEIRLIWGWWHTDPWGAREWIGQRLDEGVWDVLPLLTRLRPERTAPFREVDAEETEALAFLIGSQRLDTELDKHRNSPEHLGPYEDHLVRSLSRHRGTDDASP